MGLFVNPTGHFIPPVAFTLTNISHTSVISFFATLFTLYFQNTGCWITRNEKLFRRGNTLLIHIFKFSSYLYCNSFNENGGGDHRLQWLQLFIFFFSGYYIKPSKHVSVIRDYIFVIIMTSGCNKKYIKLLRPEIAYFFFFHKVRRIFKNDRKIFFYIFEMYIVK